MLNEAVFFFYSGFRSPKNESRENKYNFKGEKGVRYLASLLRFPCSRELKKRREKLPDLVEHGLEKQTC